MTRSGLSPTPAPSPMSPRSRGRRNNYAPKGSETAESRNESHTDCHSPRSASSPSNVRNTPTTSRLTRNKARAQSRETPPVAFSTNAALTSTMPTPAGVTPTLGKRKTASSPLAAPFSRRKRLSLRDPKVPNEEGSNLEISPPIAGPSSSRHSAQQSSAVPRHSLGDDSLRSSERDVSPGHEEGQGEVDATSQGDARLLSKGKGKALAAPVPTPAREESLDSSHTEEEEDEPQRSVTALEPGPSSRRAAGDDHRLVNNSSLPSPLLAIESSSDSSFTEEEEDDPRQFKVAPEQGPSSRHLASSSHHPSDGNGVLRPAPLAIEGTLMYPTDELEVEANLQGSIEIDALPEDEDHELPPATPPPATQAVASQSTDASSSTSSILLPELSPPSSKPRPAKPRLSEYNCPICFSPPTHATMTPCGHILCGECLFTAVKTTIQRSALHGPASSSAKCPVCRAPIPGWDGQGGGVIGLKLRVVHDIKNTLGPRKKTAPASILSQS